MDRGWLILIQHIPTGCVPIYQHFSTISGVFKFLMIIDYE